MKNLRSLSYNFCFLYPMLIDYTDLQREVVPSDTRNTGHSMDGSGTGRQNTKNIYIRSAHFITDYRGTSTRENIYLQQELIIPTCLAWVECLTRQTSICTTMQIIILLHILILMEMKYYQYKFIF